MTNEHHNSERCPNLGPTSLFDTTGLTATVSKVKCYTCNHQFGSKRERRKHYDASHMNMMLPFPTDEPCYTCDDILETKTDLRDHYNNCHSEIILYCQNAESTRQDKKVFQVSPNGTPTCMIRLDSQTLHIRWQIIMKKS